MSYSKAKIKGEKFDKTILELKASKVVGNSGHGLKLALNGNGKPIF